MKVTTIMGSPRKKGNTAKVLNWVEEELITNGHEIDHIAITDYKVNPCLACDECQQHPDTPVCSQKDDAVKIFYRMMEADLILFASPLYCWGFPAQLKALVDRCGWVINDPDSPEFTSILEGKNTALLVTCAGPVGDNADLIQESFSRLTRLYKCELAGSMVIPFTSEPDNLTEETMGKAIDFAGEILGD